jgi:hypothetical protein
MASEKEYFAGVEEKRVDYGKVSSLYAEYPCYSPLLSSPTAY